MAKEYVISKKIKVNVTLFSSKNDFEFEKKVEILTIEQVLSKSFPSLYAFDTDTNEICLVVTDVVQEELLSAPFLYIAQYEHAIKLITMEINEFPEFSKRFSQPASPICLLFSTGRCGSTLLSNALRLIDGVTCISEPDFFTNIIGSTLSETEKKVLLIAATNVLFSSVLEKNTFRNVIKFRSYGIELADTLLDSLVDSYAVFVYRNVGGWANSYARALRIFEPGSAQWIANPDPKRIKYIPLLSEDSSREYTSYLPEEFLALSWLSTINKYANLVENKRKVFAIDYDHLLLEPIEEIARILNISNNSGVNLRSSLVAFTSDSQKGTVLAKNAVGENCVITQEHIEKMTRIVQSHGELIAKANLPAKTFSFIEE